MPTPRVSVVIPTYNRQTLVLEAIESVLGQTFKDFEIIVVDDGSTDETSIRLRPYLDRIIYHVQKNQGVAAARNTGIRLSQGEFICFLDSDDLWLPAKLAKQISFADAHPEYGLISADGSGFEANKKPAEKNKSEVHEIHNGSVVEHLLFGNWILTSTVMVRRKCLEEVGGFDEDIGKYGEDWLLWMRVASKFPIYFLPEVLGTYRLQPGGLTDNRPEEQFQSLMRCIQKLSVLPQFKKKPSLLRKAEYRICLERAWNNRSSGEYDYAIVKLKRACKLQAVPVVPACQLFRTFIEKRFRRKILPEPSL